ncbi:hypothetical protein SAMN05421738_10414 [Algoriella xinjiangensis]|uniref:Lipoprotein n=1 Tax=Algoriella xinjiangensis TaxID=684065 RepID=A0A1I4UMC0_9FLAO|nr:hypothetical protein [Algoriella xinjiangensis]SFM90132.1 hypothetical protein SAMN05421738_10414 [Algoriella xinjiangensis]
MNKYIVKLLLFSTILLLFIGCSKHISPNSSNLHMINSSSQQIIVSVEGIGNNEGEAIYNGELKMIKTLLFQGIPDTNYSLPLINESEENVMNNNPFYFERFYTDKYKNFIVSNQVLSNTKSKGVHVLRMEIVVNTSALRRDLEQNNVIRKFGL